MNVVDERRREHRDRVAPPRDQRQRAAAQQQHRERVELARVGLVLRRQRGAEQLQRSDADGQHGIHHPTVVPFIAAQRRPRAWRVVVRGEASRLLPHGVRQRGRNVIVRRRIRTGAPGAVIRTSTVAVSD